jgi:hypothetical protein
MIVSAWAAARATAARSSGERSTTNRQRWALAPEGAQVAARRQRVSVASSTGSSANRRMVRAVDSTSHTSLLVLGIARTLACHPLIAVAARIGHRLGVRTCS